jgi:hypothetical protein
VPADFKPAENILKDTLKPGIEHQFQFFAIETVRLQLQKSPSIREVVFCCFSASDLAVYEQALSE